ncbi:immunity 49 family protein [Saccharopolyspora indica]|uniref:immunity 49 family protein n=1 Tax=Saccharopolyspora indica TaxID=1229659 RepID=UPI0022EAF3CF|nr:immunity 49 family protein [Saccharopolyspora indica]MDA3646476.1 immunity 49 family protein [Saccharopolyspora indica]
MTEIKRPPQNLDGLETRIEALSRNVDRFYENLTKAPALALNIAQQSLQITQWQLQLDPNAERFETYSSLLVAARAGGALFEGANNTGEQFDYIIRTNITLTPIGPTHNHTPAAWLQALWTATICRARNLVSDLCRTPDETLRAAGQYDEYIYAWIDALKAFFTNGEDLYEKINRSIELTDPARLTNSTPEIALLRYYPSMKLLFSLARRESGQFNADLAEAVELHQRFWTANNERLNSPDGFFAPGPTALAAVARDLGIPIDVESEYLPRNFVNDFWVQTADESS